MMIKKILTIGVIAASAAFLVPQAAAQTFSPDGPFTMTSIGLMNISKGLTVSCGLNGTGSVSGGAATIASISPTGGLCYLVTFASTPYTVTSGSPTSITLNGVALTPLDGNCAGSLTGDYNQSTGIITFRAATIPSTTGGNPCRITGRVQLSPTVTFTIP